MLPNPAQPVALLPLPPPPAHSRLRYESTPDGITVRSVPPRPAAAIIICIIIVFVPTAAWAVARASLHKATFSAFLVLILLAVALTLLATSSLIAFLRRVSRPPAWHITPSELAVTKAGNLFSKRVRLRRPEIVTVRGNDTDLQVITQQAGRWRAHSFPVLTTGGGWLAEVIGTALCLPPLPHQYLMTRTPDDTDPNQITYGFEGAGPRNQITTTGIPAVIPEGNPPADAAVRIRRDGDAWTITRPVPGWFERLATWAILAAALALAFYWIAFTSSGGLGAAVSVLFILFLRNRFARTCGPTILAYDNDTLHLARPTGWGTHRQTIHWWMIHTIKFHYTIRRGRPFADVRLCTRSRSTIPLFTNLPERDARWVALLIAGTFAMEEAETTWGQDGPMTMGPR